nr:MAG TPA: hypothetical protein [Caudoviricetes sp.]
MVYIAFSSRHICRRTNDNITNRRTIKYPLSITYPAIIYIMS